MKIIIENFNWKGKHIDRYESEMPNVTDLDAIPEGKIEEYISEALDILIEE